MTLRATMHGGAPALGAGAITLNAGSLASPATTPARLNFDGLFLDDWWDCTTSDAIVRVLSGTPFVSGDRNMMSNTQGKTDYALTVTRRGAAAMPTFASSNTNVATVSAAGFVTHVADGNATITVSSALRAMTFPLTFVTTNTGDQYVNGVSGSLRRHIEDVFNAAIVGKTAADRPIFSAENYPASATRNSACWGAGFNLTCASPYNSAAGTAIRGTAITPRHVIMAAHWSVAPPAVFYFVGPDNTLYSRTLIHVSYPIGDIAVGCLDSDLPAAITPAKVLPDTFATKMPLTMETVSAPYTYDYYGRTIPVLRIDQDRFAIYHEAAGIAMFTSYNGSHMVNNDTCVLAAPTAASKLALYLPSRSGDSGGPVLTFINGATVILTAMVSGYGPAHQMYRTNINDAIDSMGDSGGNHVAAVSLSGFTSF